MARQWTSEQKERQAALIHQWQPWAKSTGAKTPNGKLTSSMNAYKGGEREKQRTRRREIRGVCKITHIVFIMSTKGITRERIDAYNALAEKLDFPLFDFGLTD